MEKARQRNVTIDLFKFVYSLFIVYYHFYSSDYAHFQGGKYAVEFYMLAAGVFFFSGLERREMPPHDRIAHRFMRFLPWILSSFAITFILRRAIISGHSPAQLVIDLSGDIWEALLIDMAGLNEGKSLLNNPVWSLSAMFLVEVLMIGLFRYRYFFVHVLLPATMMAGFGAWRNLEDVYVGSWIGFTTFGMLRVWVVYGCAYYSLRLSEWLQGINFNRRGKLALTALETLCHLFAILAMLHFESRNFQWCTLLALLVAVSISLSGHSLWNTALQKLAGPIRFLGSFSLSIYLTHRPLEHLFVSRMTVEDMYAHVWQLSALMLAFALAYHLAMTWLIGFCRKNAPKIKAVFIQPDAP